MCVKQKAGKKITEFSVSIDHDVLVAVKMNGNLYPSTVSLPQPCNGTFNYFFCTFPYRLTGM